VIGNSGVHAARQSLSGLCFVQHKQKIHPTRILYQKTIIFLYIHFYYLFFYILCRIKHKKRESIKNIELCKRTGNSCFFRQSDTLSASSSKQSGYRESPNQVPPKAVRNGSPKDSPHFLTWGVLLCATPCRIFHQHSCRRAILGVVRGETSIRLFQPMPACLERLAGFCEVLVLEMLHCPTSPTLRLRCVGYCE
jgi:hypothetical protein